MQKQISDGYTIGVIYPGADPNNCIAYRPNPPTAEAVAKAQFIDKTYNWKTSN